MKKLIIDGCIGCGACVALDGEHFDFNDMGMATVISNDNLDSEALLNASEGCPTSAIKIAEATEDIATCNCDEDCAGCQAA